MSTTEGEGIVNRLLGPVWPAMTCLALVAACGGSTDSVGNGDRVERRTYGDTTEVITHVAEPPRFELVEDLSIGVLDGDLNYIFGRINSIAIGPDDHVYVHDGQANEIRRFDPEGRWVRTYGREGQGPGELQRADAIAVASDGRVLARDPGNGRVQLWNADGSTSAQWPIVIPNSYRSTPMWIDQNGVAWVLTPDPSSNEPFAAHMKRATPDGVVIDSLTLPSHEIPPMIAEAVTPDGRGRSRSNVPFAPSSQWSVHPSGRWVTARTDRYSIDLINPDGGPVLRFGRTLEPVRVGPAERSWNRASIENGMRSTQPNWSWGEMDVPAQKPIFRALYTGRDGRVWVLLHTEGVEEENPFHRPENPNSTPTRWVDQTLYDVFEADGSFLGTVDVPEGFGFYSAVFAGDHVWSVTQDDLGVQRLTRYVLTPHVGAGEISEVAQAVHVPIDGSAGVCECWSYALSRANRIR